MYLSQAYWKALAAVGAQQFQKRGLLQALMADSQVDRTNLASCQGHS